MVQLSFICAVIPEAYLPRGKLLDCAARVLLGRGSLIHRKTAQSDKEIQTVTGNILIKISRLKSMVGVISLVISGLVTCKLEESMGLK